MSFVAAIKVGAPVRNTNMLKDLFHDWFATLIIKKPFNISYFKTHRFCDCLKLF